MQDLGRTRDEDEGRCVGACAGYLTAGQRATLLCEAETAERRAEWWLDAGEAP